MYTMLEFDTVIAEDCGGIHGDLLWFAKAARGGGKGKAELTWCRLGFTRATVYTMRVGTWSP